MSLAAGVFLAVFFCALIVLISPLQTVTTEIAARTRPNLFDLGVAIFSGLAGTYAMIRGRQGAIVGVAIAVALMPPLAVMGFGLATLNLPILWGATFLFFTNLIAIGFSAAVLARIYGFAGRLSPRQTGLQIVLVLGMLAAFAVPLGLALRQIAWEAAVSRQAREAIAARFEKNARVSQLVVDYDAQPLRVRAVVFTPALRPGADAETTRLLAEALGRPVEVGIEQVRIGNANAQAAQLAEARGATTDPAGDRIGERLALVAGVPLDEVLIDRDHRTARVRARPLPGASLRAYQDLEARVGSRRERLDDPAHSARRGAAGRAGSDRSADCRHPVGAGHGDLGLAAARASDRRVGRGRGGDRRTASRRRRRRPRRWTRVGAEPACLARARRRGGAMIAGIVILLRWRSGRGMKAASGRSWHAPGACPGHFNELIR